MSRPMSIGKLAKAAGVNVETIRYYQRRGLIVTPHKPAGGQRKYPVDALRQVTFIRRAQLLGFTLEEIRSLLSISDGRSCGEGRSHADAKYRELGERVAELNRMRGQLRELVRLCDANRRGVRCPFIATLNGER